MTNRLLIGVALAIWPLSAFPAEQTSQTNARLKAALQQYPQADADADGVLTMAEARAFLDSRRGRPSSKAKPRGDEPARPQPDYANVAYGEDARNVLDLWLAKRGDGKPSPLAIFIHGGGFSGGDKKALQAEPLRRLLQGGVSVASINYRLIDSGPHPLQMRDGARAVQFLRYHADEYGLDKTRFACFGGSAGGCMSMWLAFHDDLANPASSDPVSRESTRLTCAAPSGGQSCLEPHVLHQWFGVRQLTEHPSTRGFFGVRGRDELDQPPGRDRARDASPLTHLTRDDPPVFASYGAPDAPVTEQTAPGVWVHHPQMGIKLKEQMDALGLECQLKYPGGPETTGDGVSFLIAQLTGQ